ncbi:MAG: hypothetical protein LQ346_003375 [Caloplaca aetnensis]|nr:MAG: hypothetical protein LQ346_003375 [Caloplaca aetnensis]
MPFNAWLGKPFGMDIEYLAELLNTTPVRGHAQLQRGSDTAQDHSVGSAEGSAEDNTPDSGEMSNLRSQINQAELRISHLEQQKQTLDQVHRQTLNELNGTKTWTADVMNELESTRSENNALKQQLQACKDDLFRMQPKSEVPDSIVAQAYDDLHEHISTWVEGEISRFEANHRHGRFGPLPDLFHHANETAIKKFLAAHPTSGGEYLVQCVIQTMLQETIFDPEILLLGLDRGYAALLQGIERNMAEAQPPKGNTRCQWDFDREWALSLLDTDPKSINIWRSETLNALSATQDVQQGRRKAVECATRSIFERVAEYLPIIINSQQSLNSLRNRVVAPAAKLADTIRTSSTTYEFKYTTKMLLSITAYNVTQQNLSGYRLVDIDTRKTLKPDSPVEASGNGQIGSGIMVLAPALYRCDPGREALQIVKATFLIQLFKPLGRRRGVGGP